MTSFLALVRDGKLELLDKQGWRECLSKYKGKQVEIRIEGTRRSSEQNRRYWGRIVETLRQVWSAGREIPLSKSQVHNILVRTFLGEDETPLGFVPMETHTLPMPRFAEYMDAIEGHFAAEGIDFPELGE